MKLFLLVRAPPKECCSVRKEIASEIVGTKDKLEINAKKLKDRFHQELLEAAETGTLSVRVYWIVKGLSIMAKSDVRESERLNKMISLMDDRAPRSSLELKSSRLSLKYLLGESGEGTGKTSMKWSSFKSVAESVREECLKSWDGLLDVQSNPTLQAATNCVSTQRALYMEGILKPELNSHSAQHIWAASYNMVAHKALIAKMNEWSADEKRLPTAFCLALRKRGNPTKLRFYISAELVRKKHFVLETHWNKESRTISWTQLKGFKPLLDVIKEQFDVVRSKDTGNSVFLMHVQLTSVGSVSSGIVGCATVGKMSELVRLEAPTAKFLQKCRDQEANARKKHANTKEPTEKSEKQQPEEYASVSIRDASRIQELGLNLLAEEAEQHEIQNTADIPEAEEEEEGENDFDQFESQGLFSSQLQEDHDEDTLLEQKTVDLFKRQTEEDLVSSVEQAIAIDTITKKQCDIESSHQQSVIQHLQQRDNLHLDALEATLEASLAQAAGVDAIDEMKFDSEENNDKAEPEPCVLLNDKNIFLVHQLLAVKPFDKQLLFSFVAVAIQCILVSSL